MPEPDSKPPEPIIPLAEGSSAPPPAGQPMAGKVNLKPSLAAEPLIKLVENMPCPKCNADMPHDAVVCMKCGYDMTVGRARQTNVGPAVEVAAPAPAGANDFSKPGKLEPLALTIIGALLLAGAMFFAGWFAPASATSAARAARVGLTALEAAIHTGTGLVAVAAVAVLLRQPLGRADFAAARVFVAFTAFLALTRYTYDNPDASTMVKGGIVFVQWVGAMAAYWAIVMVLFWKKPNEAGLLGGIHFILYVGLSAIISAQAWLSRIAETLPVAK